MINFRVIDVEQGSAPTEHAVFDDAIEAGRKLSGVWFIEDWTGEVVWSHENEK